MKEIKDKELNLIIGGIDISGSIISSFVKAIEITLELGRSLGTAFRRTFGNGICGIR